MKTKHTPGPWYTSISTPSEQREKWGGDGGGANAAVLRKTGKKIFGRETSDVIVYLPHWRDDAQNEEQIANAKLIAAAPDLLEALKLVKEAYFDKADLNTSDHNELHSSVLAALQAIKLATE